jgi:hypothetical protein
MGRMGNEEMEDRKIVSTFRMERLIALFCCHAGSAVLPFI